MLHRVITRDDYWADLDEYYVKGQQLLFFHVTFSNFTRTSFKQALIDWKLFRTIVRAPIYAYSGEDDGPKWRHFVSLFGFTPTEQHIELQNGVSRQLYLNKVDLNNARRNVVNPNPNRPDPEQPVGAGSTIAKRSPLGEQLSSGPVPGSSG